MKDCGAVRLIVTLSTRAPRVKEATDRHLLRPAAKERIPEQSFDSKAWGRGCLFGAGTNCRRTFTITFQHDRGVLFLLVVFNQEENDVRKSILIVTAGLTLLAGCSHPADNAAKAPTKPKWLGAAYHTSFDAKALKPNPAGISIPPVKYTANPDAVVTRATLVVRIDPSDATKAVPAGSQMVMAPVDVSGTDGALPDDYMASADKNMSDFLQAYCVKGKVKLSVAIAKSSLAPQPSQSELSTKLLSDWLPIELAYKNPHPNCTPHAAPQGGPIS